MDVEEMVFSLFYVMVILGMLGVVMYVNSSTHAKDFDDYSIRSSAYTERIMNELGTDIYIENIEGKDIQLLLQNENENTPTFALKMQITDDQGNDFLYYVNEEQYNIYYPLTATRKTAYTAVKESRLVYEKELEKYMRVDFTYTYKKG